MHTSLHRWTAHCRQVGAGLLIWGAATVAHAQTTPAWFPKSPPVAPWQAAPSSGQARSAQTVAVPNDFALKMRDNGLTDPRAQAKAYLRYQQRAARYAAPSAPAPPASAPTNALTLPFSENFEGATLPALPTGLSSTTLGTDGGFVTSIADSVTSGPGFWSFPDPPTGTQFAITNDDACNCDKSEDYLLLPALDFSGATDVVLSFNYLLREFLGVGRGTVEASTNGTSWTIVDSLPLTGNVWASNYSLNLNAFANQDSVLIRFKYNDGGVWGWGMAVDNILVSELTSPDVAVLGFESPFEDELGCYDTEEILVVVSNVGAGTQTNVPVTVVISGAASQTLTDTIASLTPGTTDTLSLGTFTFAAAGEYTLTAFASLTTDSNPANDTASLTIEKFDALAFPYSENFDNPALLGGMPDRWISLGDMEVDEFGADGSQALRTNLWVLNPADGFATPPVALPNDSNLVLTFDYRLTDWVEEGLGPATAIANNVVQLFLVTDYCDEEGGLVLVDSIYSGNHVASQAYATFSIPLGAYAGEEIALLMVGLRSSGNFNLDVDNVRFAQLASADAQIVSVLPPSGCDLGDSVTIRAVVRNNGDSPLATLSAAFTVNGGPATTDTFVFDPALAFGERDTITFATTADLSGTGPFTIAVIAQLAGDADASNDTATATVAPVPSVAVPYEQTFAGAPTAPAGFSVQQVNGTGNWAFRPGGVPYPDLPANPLLSPQFGNATAFFNSYTFESGAQSRLLMPCTDIPADEPFRLTFRYTRDGQYNNPDSIVAEVSTDGGISFERLGAVARFQSGLSVPTWTMAEFDLSQYAGQTVRFAFRAVAAFGNNMAIDVINLEPVPGLDFALTGFTIGEYVRMPRSQSLDPVPLIGTVRNNGADTLTNVRIEVTISSGGNTLATLTSPTQPALLPDAEATLVLANTFVPENIGAYLYRMTVRADQADTDTTDNFAARTLFVTDSIFARHSGFGQGSGGWGVASTANTATFGTVFELFDLDTLTSVSFEYLNLGENGIQAGDTSRVLVYGTLPSGVPNPSDVIATSNRITFTALPAAQTARVVVATFPDTVVLEPGSYFVAVTETPGMASFGLAATGAIFTPNRSFYNIDGAAFIPFDNLDEATFVIQANFRPGMITSLRASAVAQPIRLYPNPSTGLIRLQTERTDVGQIQVFSALGRLVAQFPAGQQQLDLSTQPNGVYTVRMATREGLLVQPLILSR